MKLKNVFLLAVVLVSTTVLSAQTKTFEAFKEKYKGTKGCVVVELPKIMIHLGLAAGEGDPKERELLRSLDRICIIAHDAATAELYADAAGVYDGDYENLGDVDAEGQKVKMRMAADRSELLMFVADGTDVVMMVIEGRELNIEKLLSEGYVDSIMGSML